MTILGLCFQNLPELSNSDSTCQRVVMGSDLSLRHKIYLWLIKGHQVPEGAGSTPPTSLQEAGTSAVNVDLVREVRWGAHWSTGRVPTDTRPITQNVVFCPKQQLVDCLSERRPAVHRWQMAWWPNWKVFKKKSLRTQMGLPNLRK